MFELPLCGELSVRNPSIFIRNTPIRFQLARFWSTSLRSGIPRAIYDVSPDGQRFLIVKDSSPDEQPATSASMVVVEHWFEKLKQRVNGR